MTEDPGVNISDSVVMGGIHQNITNTTCPSCEASNVRVMKCQESNCDNRFCELCHPNCRYSDEKGLRFDSGAGSGPFCSPCMSNKFVELERKRQERLEKEKLERSVAEYHKRLEKGAKKAAARRAQEIRQDPEYHTPPLNTPAESETIANQFILLAFSFIVIFIMSALGINFGDYFEWIGFSNELWGADSESMFEQLYWNCCCSLFIIIPFGTLYSIIKEY